MTTVYPRVGGGTWFKIAWQRVVGGLSPRGRGNLLRFASEYLPQGSIPAWAGEPMYTACWSAAVTVYPRVGGGTLRMAPKSRF